MLHGKQSEQRLLWLRPYNLSFQHVKTWGKMGLYNGLLLAWLENEEIALRLLFGFLFLNKQKKYSVSYSIVTKELRLAKHVLGP